MAADTKPTILDAAEKLFVERGIEATSLRSIIGEAGVNLAAVHYHFGSKEALVRAVFSRRCEIVNRERLQTLDSLETEAGDGLLLLEDVLCAFIAPAIRLSQEPGEGNRFMRLIGRMYAEPADYMQVIFKDLFKEVIERYTAAFRRALPGMDPAERFWGIFFAIGAMAHTMMESHKVNLLSGGLCDTSDTNAMIARLVRFGAAGIRAGLPENVVADGCAPNHAEVEAG